MYIVFFAIIIDISAKTIIMFSWGDNLKDTFINSIVCKNTLFRHAKGESIESGKEFHSYNEIILFLGGDGEFISENIHTSLDPDSIIFIPKETYHQLIIHNSPEEYYRCVINFNTQDGLEPFFKEKLKRPFITKQNDATRYLFDRLKKSVNHPCAKEILEASVTMLLCELEVNDTDISTPQSEVVRKAVCYIDKHINESITVDEIASYCNVSVSLLSHIFKKEMNISPYKFTIKKRLINANRKIMNGEPSTSVALECGWSDYSGFYKQYYKTFGKSPSTK